MLCELCSRWNNDHAKVFDTSMELERESAKLIEIEDAILPCSSDDSCIEILTSLLDDDEVVDSASCSNDLGKEAWLKPTGPELEMCSNAREKKDLESWYRRFNEWLEYKKIALNGDVPQVKPRNGAEGAWSTKLANWVNKQRCQKTLLDKREKSKLTPEKVNLLETHGFKWAKPRDVFDANYEKLRLYTTIVGTADVPVNPFKKGLKNPQQHLDKVIEKLVKGKAMDADKLASLRRLLLDRRFRRWISEMRTRFKVWGKIEKEIHIPAKNMKRYKRWLDDREKLEKLNFRFSVLGRKQKA